MASDYLVQQDGTSKYLLQDGVSAIILNVAVVAPTLAPVLTIPARKRVVIPSRKAVVVRRGNNAPKS